MKGECDFMSMINSENIYRQPDQKGMDYGKRTMIR